LHLTRYTDYSLRVLIYLAARPDRFGTIQGIADAYGISRNHLMKVVQALNHRGYIDTVRGKGGGMHLRLAPAKIGIGRVVRDMESDLELVECFGAANQCVITPECALKGVLADALQAFVDVLDRYTLADLVRQPEPLRRLLRVRTLDASAGAPSAGVQTHGQIGDAADEVVGQPLRFARRLHPVEALLDLLPQHAQLHLGQPVAHAAMDAVAERHVLSGVGPVDDELVGVVEHSSSRLPEMYHITTLSPWRMVLPPSSVTSSVAVRRMCSTGVCQRIISATMLGISSGWARSLSYWSGIAVQRQHAAADGIAGGVVAADDQQQDVAEKFGRPARHVAGGLAVGQHRDQIIARRLAGPLLPQVGERGHALAELPARAAGMPASPMICGDDVVTSDQCTSLRRSS
jgi:Rrf2 family transcriptional regulator, nitric oxide-sensitive transcriptional repressor